MRIPLKEGDGGWKQAQRQGDFTDNFNEYSLCCMLRQPSTHEFTIYVGGGDIQQRDIQQRPHLEGA